MKFSPPQKMSNDAGIFLTAFLFAVIFTPTSLKVIFSECIKSVFVRGATAVSTGAGRLWTFDNHKV